MTFFRKRESKKLKRVCRRYWHHYTLHNTLVVDDTPSTYIHNYGNALQISTFHAGDRSDRGLLQALETMQFCVDQFALCGNVRQIQKKITTEFIHTHE